MSDLPSEAGAMPHISTLVQDALSVPTKPQFQVPAAVAWSPLITPRNPLRALPFRPKHAQELGENQDNSAPQPENVFSLPIRSRSRTFDIDISTVLNLNNDIGREAIVAVVEDIAREMREEGYINESDYLIKECREQSSQIDYDNDIINRFWSALRIALRSTHLITARRFQKIVQQVSAANKTRISRYETELARAADELLQDVKCHTDVQRRDARSAQRSADIVSTKFENTAKCQKEVEVIAKKSILLALLLRYTEHNIDAAMNEVIDDNESLVDDSAPAECT